MITKHNMDKIIRYFIRFDKLLNFESNLLLISLSHNSFKNFHISFNFDNATIQDINKKVGLCNKKIPNRNINPEILLESFEKKEIDNNNINIKQIADGTEKPIHVGKKRDEIKNKIEKSGLIFNIFVLI